MGIFRIMKEISRRLAIAYLFIISSVPIILITLLRLYAKKINHMSSLHIV